MVSITPAISLDRTHFDCLMCLTAKVEAAPLRFPCGDFSCFLWQSAIAGAAHVD
jgi:hypothetical protein